MTASTSTDFIECMANIEDINDEVEVIGIVEVSSSTEDHKCDLCCEGEFLIHKMLTFSGLINKKYRHVCEKCDKNFIYQSELRSHIAKCTGEEFKRIKLNNSWTNTNSLYLKMCSSCNKTFKSQRGLTRHMQVKHSDLTHTCEICEEVFRNYAKFKYHCFEHEKRKHFLCI